MANINTVLIVDTETTALKPEDGHCIEVGAVLFSVPLKSTICQLSFVLPCLINPAQDVNNIPPAVTTLGPDPQSGISYFMQLASQANAIVCHNVDFDRQWFGTGMLPLLAPDKPWICTMSDVRWPKELRIKNRPSVTTLALSYGIPVWAAHRALTDCIYIAQIFERCDNLGDMLESALEPKAIYQALVSYEDRHLAKDEGFSWNADGQKTWTKKMTESEAAKLGFATRKLA